MIHLRAGEGAAGYVAAAAIAQIQTKVPVRRRWRAPGSTGDMAGRTVASDD